MDRSPRTSVDRTSRPLRRRVDSSLAAPIVAFPVAMKRRPSSAPPVRKRPAGPRPARATPSQPSLSPVDAYEHLDLSLRKSPSANSEMNLRSSASASGAVVQRAETGLGNASTNRAVKMMDELRALGYWPRAASGYEYSLRNQICRHIEDGVFSIAQTAEIEAMKKTMQADVGRKIMENIRALGYTPKRKSEHDHLAQTYQTAVKLDKISPLQKQEAEALTAAHQASLARSLSIILSARSVSRLWYVCARLSFSLFRFGM